jgi:asparagine synthase (glutamine-hydrolysing)
MCGIAGIFTPVIPKGKEQDNYTAVARMLHRLQHRGPDDYGIWATSDKSMVLGHRRLAIIDLSPTGRQPMASVCGRYFVTFNGEIYNYLELRRDLITRGYSFRTTSDTEVLLAAVAHYGFAGALGKFIGMFAFALWDQQERKLFLVRDRAGKKPLYYMQANGVFYFASEIKALRGIRIEGDFLAEDALYHYLSFGFLPSPKTIYKGISKIPPAHYLEVDATLEPKITPYWRLIWHYRTDLSFDEALVQLENLLVDAVHLRLRADVPLGCFLSGGIDSGLITALASIKLAHPVTTLTVSFSEGQFDESSLARKVAIKYGTDHHDVIIEDDLRDLIPRALRAYDEPFADPSAIPSYVVSREARKYFTVVLNGDGGDEILAGYRRHQAIYYLMRIKFFTDLLSPSWLEQIFHMLPIPRAFRSPYAFLYRFIKGVNAQPYDRYMDWSMDGFNEMEKTSLLLNPPLLSENSESLLTRKLYGMVFPQEFDRFMAADFFITLPDCLLTKMDIATMAHGLEARSPFLDHRLIEWAATIPSNIKMQGFRNKPLLRALARKYLPLEIVQAPKRGFEIPLLQWLNNDLKPMVWDACLATNGIVLKLCHRKSVEDLLNNQQGLSPRKWARVVWILFVLSLWGNDNEDSLNSQ